LVRTATMSRASTLAPPRRRVILLGASNLARGISTIVESAQLSWGQPLDFIAALGHGRSYGLSSNVLGRTLPGIATCQLWNDLDCMTQIPTASVVTDIGNDLLYGADVARIVSWVRVCLERLAPRCQRLVITGLPLSSLSKVGDTRFLLMRSVLFPHSRLTPRQARTDIAELNEQLIKLAIRFDATLVLPRAHWYGWDPIHIRMTHWKIAWQEIFSPWRDGRDCAGARGSLMRWIRLRLICPRQRSFFGWEQQRAQPAATLQGGTTISFY
jgi:hypothetical protein